MNTFTTFLIATLALVSSCNSPQERSEQRQTKAKEQYDQKLKQSQEQFQTYDINVCKRE